MANTEFRVMKDIVQPDSRGRIYLGSAVASKLYRASTNNLGQILLEPVVAIPEREAWLFENPEALSAVKQGLQESAEGLATSLGSFAEYADGSLPEFIQKMRLAAAVKWYELGEISQGKAAEVAGLSRSEFIEALGRYQVSVFQYDANELAEEVNNVS